MDTSTPDYDHLHAAITETVNVHDLLGVLDLGAPAGEYDPEMEDFARLVAGGTTITPEVVANVWHKWFGDPADDPGPPTSCMAALAADLLAVQQTYGRQGQDS